MDLQAAKDKEVELGTAFGAVNYEFAYNNMDYSDFVLRIKVLSTSVEDEEQLHVVLGCAENENSSCGEENDLCDLANGNLKRKTCCNKGEEPEIQSVATLHANSLLLSAHSPFFRKLFTNGMRESKQREATLCVTASEGAAVMDLLRYIYSGRVQANTGNELLNVIEAAEKFGAIYCIKYCVRLLLISPMTIKLAMMVMRLPVTVLQNDAVRPLAQAAILLLIEYFKDFKRNNQEALTLPLEGVKALLVSDLLEVESEDEVYDFVMAWARAHYVNVEERVTVMANSLLHLIRFPMMTIGKLRDLQREKDIEHSIISHFVSEAFVYKAELLHRQKQMAKLETQTRRFIDRAYKKIPIRVIEFDKPYRHYILYLSMKRKACTLLPLPGQLASENFDLEYGTFYLICQRVVGLQQEMFRLDVRVQSLNSLTYKLECKFAARSKAMRLDFYNLHTTTHAYKDGESGTGLSDPYKTYWSSFVAESSPYFIDDVLSLRIEIVHV
eukprot:c23081_g1_i1 orf=237-1730(-)